MFEIAAENSRKELEDRIKARGKELRFGISFLDHALHGISQNDLILIGAPSGIGKTQLCCEIAQANLEDGRRVNYIALEASQFEIERRLKYKIFSRAFYALDSSIRRGRHIAFNNWAAGLYADEFSDLENLVTEFFENAYKGLGIYYKHGDFGIPEFIDLIVTSARETDLIICDHVHYFDFDDENENRAMREIAKTARTLALEESKPIILVSHLRKRDKFNQELVSGLDEFHGSSDLTKIATKVITIAPGSITESGQYETFFRAPKNREQGSVTRYLARMLYDNKTNSYQKAYKLGLAGLTRTSGFEELDFNLYPEWARDGSGKRSNGIDDAKREPSDEENQRGSRFD